jgi:hypothetical protein
MTVPRRLAAADPATAVREHVRAFSEGDLDALMAGFTDDAVWITGDTVVAGGEALAEFFARAMAGLLPRLAVQTLVAGADRVACELVETIVLDGEERTFHIAGFYQLRGGRIATAKIYREGSAEVA